jgi:hypothetical protein
VAIEEMNLVWSQHWFWGRYVTVDGDGGSRRGNRRTTGV